MSFERIGDIVVHYELTGRDERPAIVFANSLGTDFRTWVPVLPLLGDGFRYLRYDLRGHGLTDATVGPYTIDALVQDLTGLLDQLQIANAIVCGLSVGGMIAQGLAAARPERVRALVLCDTAHRIGPPSMWAERMSRIEADGIEALADPILERWFSPGFRHQLADEARGWRNMLTRTPVDGYLGTCAAIRDADLTTAAAGIRVPTLCLCGAEDGATPPELVRELAALIPDASFRLIDGAGHLPCVEQPEAMVGHMKAFFREVESV